ncbi:MULTISPECIES: hypothetical protein [Streptomyces]|uniref:hypothetical protein n=1 Tax=Streptomyces TaxID=1883 RepID=UPI0004BD8E41|nr:MULTISPECIES: hypothetical protein [Streptomyces]KJY19216.1 hypothetical protein VR43_21405 [Streptomyces sp. NRRL S-104]KOU72252.1 hypothetical protein ADK96_05825 [Streptomyces sp. IGB124]KOU95743.1 hypothetical protein ADK93_04550 [Streptomyces sp. XY58]KOV11290.1 hypothetical protein ADK89_03890 [Streptomyces sp. XY37]KOV26474.1 hypothetical protein ADK90_04210 [Streptomyces sp. XY413]
MTGVGPARFSHVTLDDLYTSIVAEEIESPAEPERLPLLTRAEADLVLAVLDVVAGGSMDDEVRSTARALRSRLGPRLCTEGPHSGLTSR